MYKYLLYAFPTAIIVVGLIAGSVCSLFPSNSVIESVRQHLFIHIELDYLYVQM